MTKTLRNRLTLLGTASLFAVALVAAPVQFNTVTPDLAVAQASGPDGESGGTGGRDGRGGFGGSGSHGGGAGGDDNDSSGGVSGR